MILSEKITENIFRIKVPFDNVYTSVFIIKVNDFLVLADTATTEIDVKEYIIPAIEEAGGNLKYMILSHNHGDHAGGCRYLKEIYPDAKVILFDENYAINKEFNDYIIPKDEEVFFDCIKVFNFKGHSKDSLGLLDLRTDTLLTFDSFQLMGVGKYGTGLWDIKEYFSSLDRAKQLRINTLTASHDYYPMGSVITGENIDKFFDECRNCIYMYKDFLDKNPLLDSKELADFYNETFPERPTISKILFELIKETSL